MTKSDFSQLLKRYIAGTATEEEQQLIDQCYELLYNHSLKPLKEAELEVIEKEMWNLIQRDMHLPGTGDRKTRPLFTVLTRWAVAALVVGIIATIAILSSTPPSAYLKAKKEKNLLETVNNTNGPVLVSLADATTVTLQPGAKIAYPERFTGEKREVYLEGEGFFTVTKNPLQPFLVHSHPIIAQVLGTSFSVKPDRNNRQIVVAVRTGKVSVYEEMPDKSAGRIGNTNNGVIVTPNQKVAYDNGTSKFTTALVEDPQVIASQESASDVVDFSFEDQSLKIVLDKLASLYGVDISVESENTYNCRFSGNITRLTLYEKLGLICESTNHRYEVKGTTILITGKGCF